jgi:hypothetical protein
MKYKKLVVNGCSYMELYAKGSGQRDLANRLSIPDSASLAIGGSANSRIIRTTLKHSYEAEDPTFYVLGMTFLSRNEIPILLADELSWEGPWTNPQNQDFKSKWMPEWTQSDTDLYVKQKLKTELFSTLYRLEDLQYKILSMISSLTSRGHGVVVFQQADDLHLPHMDNERIKHLRNCINVVGEYKWRGIVWQHEQGVPTAYSDANAIYPVPDQIKHRAPGAHQKINEYLANYIQSNQLI